MGAEAIVVEHCCNNANHCWNAYCKNGNWDHWWGTFVATIGTEVMADSQQWPRITLSQEWRWILLLPLLFLSYESDLCPHYLCSVVMNEATWRHLLCCSVRNTSVIPVYSKKYTFPILLNNRCSHECYLWVTVILISSRENRFVRLPATCMALKPLERRSLKGSAFFRAKTFILLFIRTIYTTVHFQISISCWHSWRHFSTLNVSTSGHTYIAKLM
jgi:hypothetical protein